jgi:hypothetical protein
MIFRPLLAAMLALCLGGCAFLNNLHNQVSTYGAWPTGRPPASFVFERLPSQQASPEHQQMLETAARGALETAGFRMAADPAEAEFLMQLGARVSSTDPWIYNDPLFWRGGPRYGYGRWGRGPYWGWHGGLGVDSPTFDREVALLIRDRRSGVLLYEARADNSGPSASIDYLLPAMFEAALKDFPAVGPNPRDIVVPISR